MAAPAEEGDHLLASLRRATLVPGPPFVHVRSPVQPGEEIVVSYHWPGRTGSLAVNVHLGDHDLGQYLLPAGRECEFYLDVARLASETRRVLYRQGHRRVTISTQVDGVARQQQAELEVRLPDVSSWWQWKWPLAGRKCYWHSPYRVGGELSNLASRLQLKVTSSVLDEVCDDGSGRLVTTTRVAPPVAAAGGHLAVFDELDQRWEWSSWSSPPGGDTYRKTFTYRLSLAIEDEFGNPYAIETSLPNAVVVEVAPKKRWWWRGEAALRGAGVALVLAPVQGVASTTRTLAQRVLGGKNQARPSLVDRVHRRATDPLTPDFDFATRVPMPEWTSLASRLPDGASLRRIDQSLNFVEDLVAADETVEATSNKWLGARTADDADAARVQASHYAELIVRIAALRQRALEHFKDLSAADPLAWDEVIRFQLDDWYRSGVPTETRGHWEKDGLPTRWIEDAIQSAGPDLLGASGLIGLVRDALDTALKATADLVGTTIIEPYFGPAGQSPTT